MIEDLYDVAISCGVGPFLFWEMTLGEIRQQIKMHHDNATYERKKEIMDIDFASHRIAECVAPLLNSENKVLSIYEYFPGLFSEEVKIEEKRSLEYEMIMRKERMLDLIEEQNMKCAIVGGEYDS